ncbi:futalosine synthase, partial [bacterium]|nr:futalosine synthase [bacterium]
SYDLTLAHLEGVRLFYSHAARLGVLPAAPEVQLYGEGGGV